LTKSQTSPRVKKNYTRVTEGKSLFKEKKEKIKDQEKVAQSTRTELLTKGTNTLTWSEI